MHTIKPIDKDALKKINKNYKLLVTVEEHSLMGGLGSAVAEYISSLKKVYQFLSIGIPDYYKLQEVIPNYFLNICLIHNKSLKKLSKIYFTLLMMKFFKKKSF